MKVLFYNHLVLLIILLAVNISAAQTSSNPALSISKKSDLSKGRIISVGKKVKVITNKNIIKGRIMAVKEKSIIVNDQDVPVASIAEIRTARKWKIAGAIAIPVGFFYTVSGVGVGTDARQGTDIAVGLGLMAGGIFLLTKRKFKSEKWQFEVTKKVEQE